MPPKDFPDPFRNGTLGCPLDYDPCPAKPDPAPNAGAWTLYVWDGKRMQWMRQDEYTNVSLEVALTGLLKWKNMGQTVRMDSAPNYL